MPQPVIDALSILLQVLFYSLAYFIAWVAFMAPAALWRKVQKQLDKEIKERDAIIVKRNDTKEKLDKEIDDKMKQIQDLDSQIEEKQLVLGIATAEEKAPEEEKETPSEVTKPEKASKAPEAGKGTRVKSTKKPT